MLLVIDVGNTTIVFGLFEAGQLICRFRLETDRGKSAAEYGAMLQDGFAGVSVAAEQIQAVAMASVVPQLDPIMEQSCCALFGKNPFSINIKTETGITMGYASPESLGIDRLVNAVAAYARYESAAIAIDMGTATTFDFVDHAGVFQGGAIAPGIGTAADALFEKAARLPRIDLAYPERVIGRTTAQCMQSGIVSGYVCMVEGMIQRIKAESGTDARVIATGGLARLVAPHCPAVDTIDEHLLLRGIKLIYERCCIRR